MLRTASRQAASISFLLAVLASAGASAAPDPHAVADALVAAINASGKAQASYAAVAASGDTITLSGFKIVEPNRPSRGFTVASIAIAGAADRPAGGFTTASMTFNQGAANVGKDVTAWQTAVVKDAIIPTADEVQSLSNQLLPFTAATVSGITIATPDLVQPISIAKVDVAMAKLDNGAPDGVTISTTDVHVPASAFSDPETRGVLKDLGYTELVGSLTLNASFDTAADKFALRSFELDVTDAGKLFMTGAFSSVKVHGLLGVNADGKPAPRQTPSIDGLTVRFDNAGVIERALDMQAQLIGMTREDMANQWPQLLTMMVGGAGDMAFEEKLQADLTTFLLAPKTLTISLAPPTPVPVGTVLRQAMSGDRSKLPSMLALTITVNN